MSRHRTTLALILAFAWVPASHAFPPCPRGQLQLIPVDAPDGFTEIPSSQEWATGYYGFVGKPEAFFVPPDAPEMDATQQPINKCHDPVQVSVDHTSSGTIGMQPQYAPDSGFGVVALPELRYATAPLNLRYTLTASIDNRRFVKPGQWVDLMQLTFHWSSTSSSSGSAVRSTVYRLRKTQNAAGTSMIAVIESRAAAPGSTYHHPDRLVATIPANTSPSSTPVYLRWEAHTSAPDASTSGAGAATTGMAVADGDGQDVVIWNVDAAFEVVDARGTRLYRVELPGQAADELSLGLLDYNITKSDAYANDWLAEMRDTYMRVDPL